MENYSIVKFINKGSYGKIYLVEKKSSKNKYALKSISIKNINRYNKVSILNEIKILLVNNNEYLLKCYDLFIHENNLCIITDFIDNGDLEGLIKNKPRLTQEEITKIFLKICVGINSLHKNDIVHRDIKPANILLTKEGDIRICDFGIAKHLGFSKITNTVIGTPYFMSPEQMNEHYYDFKVDVWGIGCVLFELLYKKHPFNAKSMYELKENIKIKNPLQNIEFNSNIERLLTDFFQKNKHARPDLDTFLENKHNKQLLKHYGINVENKKFKSYFIKSVPYTERDWVRIIGNIKNDFSLPQSPIVKKRSEKKLLTRCENVPDLHTYKAIKEGRLKPISLHKHSIKKKPLKPVTGFLKKNHEKLLIDKKSNLDPIIKKKSKKKWDIENARKMDDVSWAEMYRLGKPLPKLKSKIKNYWENNDKKTKLIENPKQLNPIKQKQVIPRYKSQIESRNENIQNWKKHRRKNMCNREQYKWMVGLRNY